MSKAQKKFQIDIQSPYEILPHLEYPGLVILEIYQRWAGPSPAVEGVFRGYYTTYLNAKIRFVRAPSDILPWTRRFHGRCRPVFILILGGVVKKIFVGVDLPLMDKEIPTVVPSEEVDTKQFLPEAQFPELQNDQQFTETWTDALLQRNTALEAAQIAKDNGVDPDVDPNDIFDKIILKNQLTWKQLEEFKSVQSQQQFSMPDASHYESTVKTQDEKLAEFVGQLEEVKKEEVVVSDKPEDIISRLLPKFQQFYETQPDKIEVSNIFQEIQSLEVGASQDLIEKMATLADVQNDGKIDKLDACLIATTLAFRPRIQQIRSGETIDYIEHKGEIDKIDTLKVNKSESILERASVAKTEDVSRPSPFENSDGRSFRAERDESYHEKSIIEEPVQEQQNVVQSISAPSPFEMSDNKSMRYSQEGEKKCIEAIQESPATPQEPVVEEQQPLAEVVDPIVVEEQQKIEEPAAEQPPPSPVNPDGNKPSQFNDSINSAVEYK
ncbi:Thioredoxin like protein [Spironucleus salmonicida]|uniref:Thioredoxin like protein n=1 Tax=Spironucleus salmonicida TaxID=348837 RepID=V6LIQ5_9EUKA|nr:Thioredoxin like protein [Spironucleus salmonicida]|eukprot:EST44437.1 hypothetical protein SS50377_15745 [Spironucleus salmonicida]